MIGQDDNKVSFNGNGETTQFPYGFKILNETDLKLIHIDKAGNETLLSSDYYVNMEQSYVAYPGYAPGTEPPEYDRPPVLAYGEKLIYIVKFLLHRIVSLAIGGHLMKSKRDWTNLPS